MVDFGDRTAEISSCHARAVSAATGGTDVTQATLDFSSGAAASHVWRPLCWRRLERLMAPLRILMRRSPGSSLKSKGAIVRDRGALSSLKRHAVLITLGFVMSGEAVSIIPCPVSSGEIRFWSLEQCAHYLSQSIGQTWLQDLRSGYHTIVLGLQTMGRPVTHGTQIAKGLRFSIVSSEEGPGVTKEWLNWLDREVGQSDVVDDGANRPQTRAVNKYWSWRLGCNVTASSLSCQIHHHSSPLPPSRLSTSLFLLRPPLPDTTH